VILRQILFAKSRLRTPADPSRLPFRRRVYLLLLLLVSIILALTATVAPLLTEALTPPPQVGQVAALDYRAPRAIVYPSEIETEKLRDKAEQDIAPIYTSPDTRVARRQLEQLRATLAYIDSVRADAYATLEQKLVDLESLDEVSLDADTAQAILRLSDTHWQEIKQETIKVLETVMRSAIRDYSVPEMRNRTPSLVSLSFPEDQATIIAYLAAAFVAPNVQYSESLTQIARQNARDSIKPVTRSFAPGQTIVQQGQVLSAEDIEALQQLGLLATEANWRELVSAIALTLLLVAFVTIYIRRKQLIFGNKEGRSDIRGLATAAQNSEPRNGDIRKVAVIAVLFLVTLVGARLTTPGHTIIPYAFPVAACGLTLAALFGIEPAVFVSLPLAILVAYGLPFSLELTLYYILGCLFGILTLGRARRLMAYLWAGVAVAVVGCVVILVYRLPSETTDVNGLATLAAAAMFNGLASASLTIVLHMLMAQFLNVVTPMQLIDLTRPDHPLLRLLLREAPGTYQHSLQVANLAEQAAESIGADALLTRVGALYHDVGKIMNPVYFIENQPPGIGNPHEALEPAESAATIIRHVEEGLKLGRKYHLPARVLDFISEHHGTALARYQYVNAVQAAGGDESLVDQDEFRYPGPMPQSRETGILMLADGCEARVRAERPADEEALRNVIKQAINDRITRGHLDNTKLTLFELNQIADSFTVTLRGAYHPRLKYPTLDVPTEPTKPQPESSEANVAQPPIPLDDSFPHKIVEKSDVQADSPR
jgi:putative nucleotidyltransferase with HDIG domain